MTLQKDRKTSSEMLALDEINGNRKISNTRIFILHFFSESIAFDVEL
jgi:hypothetical protein